MQAAELLYVSSPTELRLWGDLQILTIHQDLVTYAVSEITPCLRVREAVEGSGSYPQNRWDFNLTIKLPNRW